MELNYEETIQNKRNTSKLDFRKKLTNIMRGFFFFLKINQKKISENFTSPPTNSICPPQKSRKVCPPPKFSDIFFSFDPQAPYF